MGKHDSYASILKYTGLFGGVQGFTVFISVLRNKCAAALIGTVGIALTDILNRTTDLISSMTNLGISFSGVRKLSEEYGTSHEEKINDAVCTIRAWSVGTGLFGTLLCAALAPFISKYVFDDAALRSALFTVSPIIFLMAVYGGEVAVMKGIRRLKEITVVSAVSSVLTLLITVALYFSLGLRGVPLALLLSTTAMTAVALAVTHRIRPWTKNIFRKKYFVAGKALLFLGVAYLAAGIAGSGAEMAVRAIINDVGSRADVGLYASGFVLCVTYTRIIFVAMDADYFPRLSAISNNVKERDLAVDRQIDVCVLLMAPLLIAFLTFLPLIVRILYTSSFVPAIDMCVAAGGYLFIKAIVAPIEYIPLAKNDSALYFFLELVYDIIFVGLLVAGYSLYGLRGAGWALTISYVFDLLMIVVVFGKKYGYRMGSNTIRHIFVQGCLVVLPVAMFSFGHDLLKCSISCILLFISTVFSLRRLKISRGNVKAYFARKKTKK